MYETGTATGVVDLLDKLVTFCEANGWTRDDYSSESTGKRWHAHRGSQYVNFRSFVAEVINSEVANRSTSAVTGLAFNVGTGYSGAAAWYRQAGTPKSGASTWLTGGVCALTTAITAYHFFAQNSGDQIYVILETTSGVYRYFGFGLYDKYGTITGGDFMFASDFGVETTATTPGIGFYQPTYIGSGESGISGGIAMATVDVDAETGWHCSVAQPTSVTDVVRKIVDKYHWITLASVMASPNSLNGVAVLQPVIPMIFRDSSNGTSSPVTPLGEIPNIFYINIQSLVPSQQISFGSDNYRVFPFIGKGSDQTDVTATHSGFYGLAIKE